MEMDMYKAIVATAFVLGFSLFAGQVSAQDSDAIELLTREVELLQRENDLLMRENDILKDQIEELKGGGTKKPASTKSPTLSDLFVVGAVFPSKSEHVAGPTRGITGSGTLTITSRDGDSFTGTNAWVVDQDKTSGTGEIKGTITGHNTAKWRRVDAPIGNQVIARLRADGAYVDTLAKNHAKGTVIKGTLKVDK
jgi:hypothetical protein